jgi:hypothetical protein
VFTDQSPPATLVLGKKKKNRSRECGVWLQSVPSVSILFVANCRFGQLASVMSIGVGGVDGMRSGSNNRSSCCRSASLPLTSLFLLLAPLYTAAASRRLFQAVRAIRALSGTLPAAREEGGRNAKMSSMSSGWRHQIADLAELQ